MKKGCFLLLILLTLIYACQGCKAADASINDKIIIRTSGKLSDKCYCFMKSGKDISENYPAMAMSEDQPVLFIVDPQCIN